MSKKKIQSLYSVHVADEPDEDKWAVSKIAFLHAKGYEYIGQPTILALCPVKNIAVKIVKLLARDTFENGELTTVWIHTRNGDIMSHYYYGRSLPRKGW